MRIMVKGITVMILLLVAASCLAQEKVEELRVVVGVTQIKGAWKVTLTPAPGGPPPFDMLMLFTRDGGVVQTDAGPPTPLQFSPGIGEWTWVESGRYSIDYAQLEFDSAQNHTGVFRGHLEVTLDPKSQTLGGAARVRFYDNTGEVLLFEGEGTVAGSRVKF